MNYSKTAIVACTTLLLNGCIEVDDANNAEIVSALQNQNQTLAEQNDILSAQQEPTVTFRGSIKNLRDNSVITSANITVKLGDNIVSTGEVTSAGSFQVSALPANSDVELIVTSDTNDFMQRVFYINTGASNSNQTSKDIGGLGVSEGIEVEVTVLNQEDGQPNDTLTFTASSVVGTGSTSDNYKYISIFDDVAGVYKITLPRYITTNIVANLDLDFDGEKDFNAQQYSSRYSNYLNISNANQNNINTVYLEPSEIAAVTGTEVEYRVSVLDENGNTVSNAAININDELNDDVQSTYDSDNEQHVVTGLFNGEIRLEIPSFTLGETTYNSASILLYREDGDLLRVFPSLSSSYKIPEENVLNLVVKLNQTYNPRTDLQVVSKSDSETTVNSSYSVFYSLPIIVNNENIQLINHSALTVNKGSDDDNDFVFPGETLVSRNSTEAITVSLSLNDTKLTITPVTPLIEGHTYKYEIGKVAVKSSETWVSISDDSGTFTVPYNSDANFDINELMLDNNNYTSNGESIVSTNTAEIAATDSNSNQSVYLYLPSSIRSLENFTVRKVLVVNDGSSNSESNTYTIVDSNRVYSSDYGTTLSTASNEDIRYDDVSSRAVFRGTAIESNQLVYRRNISEYLSDDLDNEENSITFEYAYETKDGEVFTGTITLPVL